MSKLFNSIQGPIVQTEVSPTADPEVMSSIPAQSHTFMEIDLEIISTVILLLLILEGLLSITSEKYVHKVLVNLSVQLAHEKGLVR